MYSTKLRHTKKYVNLIIWQRPWAFERNVFLLNAHGVARRVSAVTEIPGNAIKIYAIISKSMESHYDNKCTL